jgi:hypothetical protein
MHLTFEEVAVSAGHGVSMEADDNILLTVGTLQRILAQQLRPRSIQSLNITLNVLLISYSKLYNI